MVRFTGLSPKQVQTIEVLKNHISLPDVEVAVVALAEFLRALHDHRRDARMDAAFVVDDGFPFKYHFHRSFLLAIIIL